MARNFWKLTPRLTRATLALLRMNYELDKPNALDLKFPKTFIFNKYYKLYLKSTDYLTIFAASMNFPFSRFARRASDYAPVYVTPMQMYYLSRVHVVGIQDVGIYKDKDYSKVFDGAPLGNLKKVVIHNRRILRKL